MQVDFIVVMHCGDWERQKWRDWFLKYGEALKTSVGVQWRQLWVSQR